MALRFLKDPESHPKVTLRTVEWRCSSVARALQFFKVVSKNQPHFFSFSLFSSSFFNELFIGLLMFLFYSNHFLFLGLIASPTSPMIFMFSSFFSFIVSVSSKLLCYIYLF